jgi:hypothetical protein
MLLILLMEDFMKGGGRTGAEVETEEMHAVVRAAKEKNDARAGRTSLADLERSSSRPPHT